MPALGLSNKAVYEGDGQNEEPEDEARISGKTQYPEVYFSPLNLEGIAIIDIKVLKEKRKPSSDLLCSEISFPLD